MKQRPEPGEFHTNINQVSNMPNDLAQRINDAITPHAKPSAHSTVTLARYSPKSKSLAVASIPAADPDVPAVQAALERASVQAASTPDRPRTVVQIQIAHRTLVWFLAAAGLAPTPIAVAAAYWIHQGFTTALVTYPIYAGITGVILGLVGVTIMRRAMLMSCIKLFSKFERIHDTAKHRPTSSQFVASKLSSTTVQPVARPTAPTEHTC